MAAKFVLAGFSARFMFGMPSHAVKTDLIASVNSLILPSDEHVTSGLFARNSLYIEEPGDFGGYVSEVAHRLAFERTGTSGLRAAVNRLGWKGDVKGRLGKPDASTAV